MENVKNFSDIELTENQKRALCLGQGFVVCKSFNLGSVLLDWNKFKNKILGVCFSVIMIAARKSSVLTSTIWTRF